MIEMFIMVVHSLSVRPSVTETSLFIYLFIYFIFSNSSVIKTRKVINPDFGPQLEICLSVYSLLMVKDSYQCLKDFCIFGLQ